jgi:threonine dehydrogenase-like Zn-dependent dehydrogenase
MLKLKNIIEQTQGVINVKDPKKAADLAKQGLDVNLTETELEEANLLNTIHDYKGGVEWVLFDTQYAKHVMSDISEWATKKGFDIIFECSGSEELFNFSITALKKKGQLVILSNQIQDIKLSKKTLNALVRYEINIKGAWSSLIKPRDEWSEAIEGLVEIKNNLNNFISHDYKLSESREVFYRMHKKAFPFSKVILTP